MSHAGSQGVWALIAILTLGARPPVVPSAVLVECLTGHADRDTRTSRFLRGCEIEERLTVRTARRAARLRTLARRGSAVDAILVATAEPDGKVLTGDRADLVALAATAAEAEVLTGDRADLGALAATAAGVEVEVV